MKGRGVYPDAAPFSVSLFGQSARLERGGFAKLLKPCPCLPGLPHGAGLYPATRGEEFLVQAERFHCQQLPQPGYLCVKIGQPFDRRRNSDARMAILLVIEQAPLAVSGIVQGGDKVLAVLALKLFAQPLGPL
jgi:hypothetical protein